MRADDLCLEVGCAGGETTRIMGKIARLTYGVDKTTVPKNLQEQGRNASSRTRFLSLDANDIGSLLKLSKEAALEADGPHKGFSVILIDISGNATFNNLLTVLERYEATAVFGKDVRLIIIKSFRFANLMDRSRVFEPVEQEELQGNNKTTTVSLGRIVPWMLFALSCGVVVGGAVMSRR